MTEPSEPPRQSYARSRVFAVARAVATVLGLCLAATLVVGVVVAVLGLPAADFVLHTVLRAVFTLFGVACAIVLLARNRDRLGAVRPGWPGWHGFRRHLAVAGIGFWVYLGGYPLTILFVWLVHGDRLSAGPVQVLAQIAAPACLHTASLACAIAVLRTGDPGRSLRWSRWQVVFFLLGVGLFLGSTAVHP